MNVRLITQLTLGMKKRKGEDQTKGINARKQLLTGEKKQPHTRLKLCG